MSAVGSPFSLKILRPTKRVLGFASTFVVRAEPTWRTIGGLWSSRRSGARHPRRADINCSSFRLTLSGRDRDKQQLHNIARRGGWIPGKRTFQAVRCLGPTRQNLFPQRLPQARLSGPALCPRSSSLHQLCTSSRLPSCRHMHTHPTKRARWSSCSSEQRHFSRRCARSYRRLWWARWSTLPSTIFSRLTTQPPLPERCWIRWHFCPALRLPWGQSRR